MSAPMRRVKSTTSATGDDHRFPPEAYAYADDVSPDTLKDVRERAKKAMADDEWEVIDGFGLAEPA